ncbi:MAG: hypothetical protein ACRDTM_07060 [Micromonosporaceae bacterium]
MARRSRRTPARKPQPSSLRTRITLALLAFTTLVGTGLVVAPVAFVA